ncbi:MAG: hypothetical protein ACK5JD_14595 [Mangrovibacterium sp.]
MALENLISVEFSAEELAELDSHLAAIDTLLKAKCISLTPDERMEYSKLGNRSENWAQKIVGYIQNQPEFNPQFIDVPEVLADFSARKSIQPREARINAIADLMSDTLLLLGADVYYACIAYYRNIGLLAKQNVNGAKAIYDDLAEQFPGKKRKTVSAG